MRTFKRAGMKPRRFLSYIGGLTALVGSLFGGCSSPTGPHLRQLINLLSSTTLPSLLHLSAGRNANFKFKAHDTDGTLESLVLMFPDSTSQAWNPHISAYQDSVSHTCNTPGLQTARFIAKDNSGAQTSTTVSYTVQGNAPPVVNTSTLNGFEGQLTAFAVIKSYRIQKTIL